MTPFWDDSPGSERFVTKLMEGKEHEHRVAEIFRGAGLEVEETGVDLSDEGLATDGRSRARWHREHDLTVEGHPIEVKGQPVAFTGPDDFPYQDVMFFDVGAYDRKPFPPHAIVISSRKTTGYAVVRVSERHLWRVRSFRDKVRGFDFDAYVIDRNRLTSLDDLIAWLKG